MRKNSKIASILRADLGSLTRTLRPFFQIEDVDLYVRHLYLPYLSPDGKTVVIRGGAEKDSGRWLRERYGDQVAVVDSSTHLVLETIEENFRGIFQWRAERELAEKQPEFSASIVLTQNQLRTLMVVCAGMAFVLFSAPKIAGIAITVLLAVFFLANVAFRGFLLWIGADQSRIVSFAEQRKDKNLPLYSVLVPLYREANVVPALVRALRALDYPTDRLDIKLICEADDIETIRAAETAMRHPQFSVIRVPPGSPRTKPRACNYAMPFVRGAFTVIFDAEDRPEIDQLRKAVVAFDAHPENVACLQARLNFFNANENWITKMFALDYALWFDYLLPGLDRLNVPMPLGGTSNHFRTDALRKIYCWDPYNVTEDADLGIRLARVGLRVRTLDSTTFEEATNNFDNWLKQRSRWLKGYMQTWLVHMRSPRALLRNAGWGGFIGFQLFVGGTFLSALLNPVLWFVFLFSGGLGVTVFQAPVSHYAEHISFLSLLTGNSICIYLAMLAPSRRGWQQLTPYGLTAPFYWLLISAAGIRAFGQLFTQPWYWEKTTHGLSKQMVETG